MNYEDVILSESSRRDIYRCLSKCFQLPENGLNEILPELDRRFAVLDSQSWPSSSLLKNSFKNSEDLKDLQLDFAKLFVGHYSLLAPPYGSVYIDRQHRIISKSISSCVLVISDIRLSPLLYFLFLQLLLLAWRLRRLSLPSSPSQTSSYQGNFHPVPDRCLN